MCNMRKAHGKAATTKTRRRRAIVAQLPVGGRPPVSFFQCIRKTACAMCKACPFGPPVHVSVPVLPPLGLRYHAQSTRPHNVMFWCGHVFTWPASMDTAPLQRLAQQRLSLAHLAYTLPWTCSSIPRTVAGAEGRGSAQLRVHAKAERRRCPLSTALAHPSLEAAPPAAGLRLPNCVTHAHACIRQHTKGMPPSSSPGLARAFSMSMSQTFASAAIMKKPPAPPGHCA